MENPSAWNISDASRSTNNNVEGWHSYLNALFGLNKNLWDTIEMIQNEQIISQLDYEKEKRGKPVASRRQSQIEKEKQIKRMQIIYRNKESSRIRGCLFL